jgi:hypothetical protein
MFQDLLRAVRRLAIDSISGARGAAPNLVPSTRAPVDTDAYQAPTSPSRDAIEERVFNLVLFLRERPCGYEGLGSVDCCGTPNRESLCGVHFALEQVGADVAGLLDQLEHLQRLSSEGASSAQSGEGEPLLADEALVSDSGLTGEVVISETIRLTQKIRLPA